MCVYYLYIDADFFRYVWLRAALKKKHAPSLSPRLTAKAMHIYIYICTYICTALLVAVQQKYILFTGYTVKVCALRPAAFKENLSINIYIW